MLDCTASFFLKDLRYFGADVRAIHLPGSMLNKIRERSQPARKHIEESHAGETNHVAQPLARGRISSNGFVS